MIRSVLAQQIEALRRGDQMTAFLLASPAIKAKYGDAGTFASKSREKYDPVLEQIPIRLSGLMWGSFGLEQWISIEPDKGVERWVVCQMEKQSQGFWRVGECGVSTD